MKLACLALLATATAACTMGTEYLPPPSEPTPLAQIDASLSAGMTNAGFRVTLGTGGCERIAVTTRATINGQAAVNIETGGAETIDHTDFGHTETSCDAPVFWWPASVATAQTLAIEISDETASYGFTFTAPATSPAPAATLVDPPQAYAPDDAVTIQLAAPAEPSSVMLLANDPATNKLLFVLYNLPVTDGRFSFAVPAVQEITSAMPVIFTVQGVLHSTVSSCTAPRGCTAPDVSISAPVAATLVP